MKKLLRTDDPHVHYMEANSVQLWCHGIVEWRIDTQNKKFLMTPIMRDRSEGPVVDATEMYDDFLREQRQ